MTEETIPQVDMPRFRSLMAQMDALMDTDMTGEELSRRVFDSGLARNIREAGLISPEIPAPATDMTEVQEFYEHCNKKLQTMGQVLERNW